MRDCRRTERPACRRSCFGFFPRSAKEPKAKSSGFFEQRCSRCIPRCVAADAALDRRFPVLYSNGQFAEKHPERRSSLDPVQLRLLRMRNLELKIGGAKVGCLPSCYLTHTFAFPRTSRAVGLRPCDLSTSESRHAPSNLHPSSLRSANDK